MNPLCTGMAISYANVCTGKIRTSLPGLNPSIERNGSQVLEKGRSTAGQAHSRTGVLQDRRSARQECCRTVSQQDRGHCRTGALQDRCAAGQAHYKAGQCETGAHLGISTAGHETSAGYLRLWLVNDHARQELQSRGIAVKL